MSHVLHPRNIAVSQLVGEPEEITQAIVLIDERTNDPYIIHMNDQQASDLYYQLQRIRNLTVQAALMDVNAEAIRTIQNNVFGDYS